MSEPIFAICISSRTFEYSAGIGYTDAGGAPEEIAPLGKTRGNWFVWFHEYICDEAGSPIGARFKNPETGELHDVYPGKTYEIPVWVSAIDDDGDPEDICIHHYLKLIPYAEAFPQE